MSAPSQAHLTFTGSNSRNVPLCWSDAVTFTPCVVSEDEFSRLMISCGSINSVPVRLGAELDLSQKVFHLQLQ